MKTAFESTLEFRDAQWQRCEPPPASRHKVPAILYGGHREPRALALDYTGSC